MTYKLGSPSHQQVLADLARYYRVGSPADYLEIAEKTGLAPGSIKVIVSQLLEGGLIRRTGPKGSKRFAPVKTDAEARAAGLHSSFITPLSKARLMGGRA